LFAYINRDHICNSCDSRNDPCCPCPDVGVNYRVHPLLAVFVMYLAILMVVGSNLHGVYNTALNLYATTGNLQEAYSKELIENAFAPKPVGIMSGDI